MSKAIHKKILAKQSKENDTEANPKDLGFKPFKMFPLMFLAGMVMFSPIYLVFAFTDDSISPWVVIKWAAIIIGTFTFLLMVGIYLWEGLKEGRQETLRNIGVGFVILLMFTYWFWYAPASSETGTGGVTISNSSINNVEVKAVIERSNEATFLPLLLKNNTYLLESIELPNGSESSFSYCKINADTATECEDGKGISYDVKLNWYESGISYDSN